MKFNKGKKFNKVGKYDGKFSTRKQGTNKNNPGWYILNAVLGKLATAINMLVPNGFDNRFADGSNLVNSSIAMPCEPGVARNEVMLVPGGKTNKPTDSLNEACRAMFTYIRQKIMKNITRYEKSDLFIMLYAVAGIFAWIEYLKLILRVLKKYTVLNRYTPEAILKALNIDPTDTDTLGVQLQFYIERLVNRVNKLVVPKLPMYEEMIYAFSHIYVDEDIAKAQYIVNVPKYIMKFTVDSVTSKGKLVPVDFASQPLFKYADIVAYTENLLSELLNDEDYSFMSGDILAAYEGNIYKMSETVDTSPIEFEYSKEFLEKWHNSAQFGYAPTDGVWSDWEVTQNTSASMDDYLVFDPEFTAASQLMFDAYKRSCGNRIIDFYDKEVTDNQIMCASRWLFSNEITDVENMKMRIRTCGSQLVYRTVFYYYDANGVLQSTNYYGYFNWAENSSLPGRYSISLSELKDLLLIGKWNYCPMTINMLVTGVSGQSDGYIGLLGDLGNYTPIEPRVLENMNQLANYTLLGVTPLIEGK